MLKLISRNKNKLLNKYSIFINRHKLFKLYPTIIIFKLNKRNHVE